MPELPEVETVRDGLERFVVGATVRHVEVFREYSVRRHVAGPADFVGRLTGRRITTTARRGKFLWLSLSPATPISDATTAVSGDAPVMSDDALLAHLGMSGQLLVRGGQSADDWRHPHLRVRIHLTGAPATGGEAARYLDFVDQRTFGHLSVQDLVPEQGSLPSHDPYATQDGRGGTQEDRRATQGDPDGTREHPGDAGGDAARLLVPEAVAHIAPDLLDPRVEPARLAGRVVRRRTQIKRALLDQQVVSGVGNIYADEALWRARVHGRRATDRMRRADVVRVLDAAAQVMREALAQGGTSFDALYVNVNGQSGSFYVDLNVYGCSGQPCKRCGTSIVREKFTSRSSHFCPSCQRKR